MCKTHNQLVTSGSHNVFGKPVSHTTIGIAALAVLSVLGGWLLIKVVGLEASIITTAFIASFGWLAKSWLENKREHARRLANDKKEHYEQFLTVLSQLLQGTSEDNTGKIIDKLTPELRKWNFRLMLIGSDEVIRAWINAKQTDQTEPLNVLGSWMEVIVAMRKDAGHPYTKITSTDIIKTFVNKD